MGGRFRRRSWLRGKGRKATSPPRSRRCSSVATSTAWLVTESIHCPWKRRHDPPVATDVAQRRVRNAKFGIAQTLVGRDPDTGAGLQPPGASTNFDDYWKRTVRRAAVLA